jgi:hypothetical protein
MWLEVAWVAAHLLPILLPTRLLRHCAAVQCVAVGPKRIPYRITLRASHTGLGNLAQ